MRTRKTTTRKSGGTRKADGGLTRRAAITTLGAGLVASGLRRARALPMPETTPTPPEKTLGFNAPVTVACGESIHVKGTGENQGRSDFHITVECSEGNVTVRCGNGPGGS